jgi:hypothetical protein
MQNLLSINEMKADRQLDLLIAEQAMGAKWTMFGKRDMLESVNQEDYAERWKDGKIVIRHLPHYSTDIKAAWEVVEKFHKDGYDPCVNFGSTFHVDEWHACFYKGGHYYDAYADTAPLAICRAALLAVSE